MNRRARITWTVEIIRTCIVLFLFYVEIQLRVSSRLTFFVDLKVVDGLKQQEQAEHVVQAEAKVRMHRTSQGNCFPFLLFFSERFLSIFVDFCRCFD